MSNLESKLDQNDIASTGSEENVESKNALAILDHISCLCRLCLAQKRVQYSKLQQVSKAQVWHKIHKMLHSAAQSAKQSLLHLHPFKCRCGPIRHVAANQHNLHMFDCFGIHQTFASAIILRSIFLQTLVHRPI